jgi:hypothetical protein
LTSFLSPHHATRSLLPLPRRSPVVTLSLSSRPPHRYPPPISSRSPRSRQLDDATSSDPSMCWPAVPMPLSDGAPLPSPVRLLPDSDPLQYNHFSDQRLRDRSVPFGPRGSITLLPSFPSLRIPVSYVRSRCLLRCTYTSRGHPSACISCCCSHGLYI